MTRDVQGFGNIPKPIRSQEDIPAGASPELAQSLWAEKWWWNKIESENVSLSAAEIAKFMGDGVSVRDVVVLREEGKLLGYEMQEEYRYPLFQFDQGTRTVLPVILDIIQVGRTYDVPDDELVMFLCTPSGYFEEQDEPVRHLDDPEGVLVDARIRFGPSW